MTQRSDSPFAPIAERSDQSPIRLSILQLLVWTFAAAAVMSFEQFRRNDFDGRFGFRMFMAAFSFANAAILGWAMSCLILPFRRPPRSFPNEPGHWLLIVYGVGGVEAILTRLTILIIASLAPEANQWDHFTSPFSAGHAILFVSRTLNQLIAVLLFVAACLKSREWKLYFGFMAAFRLLLLSLFTVLLVVSFARGEPMLIFRVMQIQELGWGFVALLMTLSMSAHDLLNGRRRDWFHWSGIAMLILLVTVSWAFQLGVRFVI